MSNAAREIYTFCENYIYIEPIETCNLRCALCYMDEKTLSSKKMMEIEPLKKIVDKLVDAEQETTFYFCGGGEVTLYPHLTELLKYLNAKYKCKHIIQTNGIVPKNTLEELLTFDNIEYNISIDGDSKAHDNNRGKNTYSKTLKFYKKLIDMDIKANVRTLYTSEIDISNFLLDVGSDKEILYTIPFQHSDILKDEDLELPANFKPFPYNQNTYFAIKQDGVYSCCEGKEKIGDFEDTKGDMKRKAVNNNCKECIYYLKCK